jgi:hypothetical protein
MLHSYQYLRASIYTHVISPAMLIIISIAILTTWVLIYWWCFRNQFYMYNLHMGKYSGEKGFFEDKSERMGLWSFLGNVTLRILRRVIQEDFKIPVRLHVSLNFQCYQTSKTAKTLQMIFLVWYFNRRKKNPSYLPISHSYGSERGNKQYFNLGFIFSDQSPEALLC